MRNAVNRTPFGVKKNSDSLGIKKNAIKLQSVCRIALAALCLLVLGVGQMWGGTYTVVGVAMPNENNYVPRISLNTGGGEGCGWWNWYLDAHTAGITFEGRKLYLADWTDCHNGSDDLYFQQYSEKADNKEVNYNHVHEGYTTVGTYNNKIYEYNESGTSGSWYSVLTMTQSKVYFDATNWSETDIDLCIAHMHYQAYYEMSEISHTKLYYTNASYHWEDAMGFGVVGNHDRTDEQAANGYYWITDISDYSAEYTGFRHYALNDNSTNVAYLVVNKGNSGQKPDVTKYDSYTSLNHSQTVKKYTCVNGISYSAASVNSGTVTIEAYQMTGNGTASKTDNSGTINSAGTTELSKPAAYTGEVTVTASANTGYVFLGWFAVENDGEALSTNSSYTYNAPNSTYTIYARFAPKWAVKGGNTDSGDGDDAMGDWGIFNNFDLFATDGFITKISLAANTTYKFKVCERGTSDTFYGNDGTVNDGVYNTGTAIDWEFATNKANCGLRTGAAGDYTFVWNADTKKLSVFFPDDAAKMTLTKQKYIYFDSRTESNWKEGDFNARFYFKYLATDDDISNVKCDKGDALEDWVYYAAVPNNDYVGSIQMNRLNPNPVDENDFWDDANIIYARTRSNANQNCMVTPSSGWSGITLTWDTYCPPMSSVTLADNSTTTWGGGWLIC